MPDKHAAYYEGDRFEQPEHAITQRLLNESAGNVHEVRSRTNSLPGAKKTSPTLNSGFMPASQYGEVFDSLVAPLPHVNENPQDAVHRIGHTSGSNGGHSRKSLPTAEKRILGAGGTSAQQVFQRQFELDPVSHPMAGGKTPPRINLQKTFNQGDLPYFSLSAPNSVEDTQAMVSPGAKNNKIKRDTRRTMPLRGAR